MKKHIAHMTVIGFLLGIFIYSQLFIAAEMSYWEFLTHKYVLNIGVAGLGIIIGYGIYNYYVTLAGATFALLIYCLVFIFDSKEFLGTRQTKKFRIKIVHERTFQNHRNL